MMKKMGVVLLGMLLVGCVKGAQEPGSAPPSRDASKLQLQVIEEGTIPALPGAATDDLAELNSTFASGNELVFKDTIQIQQKALFLVWPDSALDSKIVSASYSLRQQDPTNALDGKPTPFQASYDSNAGRWFIPFDELMTRTGVELDPAWENELTLSLLLADGSLELYEIRFHLFAPLPEVQTQYSAQFNTIQSDTASDWEKTGYVDGIEISEETISNPSNRPLRFWMSGGESQIRLSSLIHNLNWQQPDPMNDPTQFEQFYQVSALMQVTKLEVDHSDAREVSSLGGGAWVSVELAPHETATLKWLAQFDDGTANCFVGAPSYGMLFTKLPTPPATQIVPVSVQGHTEIVGIEIQGTWTHQVVFSDEVNSPAVPNRKTTLDSSGVQALAVVPLDPQKDPSQFSPYDPCHGQGVAALGSL